MYEYASMLNYCYYKCWYVEYCMHDRTTAVAVYEVIYNQLVV